MKRGRQIRPMTVDDIPQVGRLFYKTFRQRAINSSNAFNDYFEQLFFGSPIYEQQYGSIVHETSTGQISSVVSAVPMQYRVNGKIITARLLCAFMTDPDMPCHGAAELALSIRPRNQDLCFTDSASPASASAFKAGRAALMPVHGLDWCRVFQPAGFFAQSAARRSSLVRYGARLPIARPVDHIIRRMIPALHVEPGAGIHDEDMAPDLFVSSVQDFLSAYPVRPVWSEPELNWILHIARQNTSLGDLNIRSVWDQNAELIGCFVYFGRPGMIAQVMNIFSRKGNDAVVINRMMYHLEQSGLVAARGHVQPRQLDALSRQRAMFYRHRAHTCASTRHASVLNAIDSNEMYVGGLAGESWSRLVSDFF